MKVLVTITSLFLLTVTFSQSKAAKKTYDYLTVFERWKVIVKPNDSFVLTTNQIFWPDTSIIANGKIVKHSDITHFVTDTASLEDKFLLKMKITNEQRIAQSDRFSSFRDFIFFKNVLRRVYDTSSFSTTAFGTYYRGDGKWSNLITLNADSTYSISESVHAMKEYEETGKWRYANGFVTFLPKQKGDRWLNKYSTNRKFYLTEDFLIGRSVTSTASETFFYFSKEPFEH